MSNQNRNTPQHQRLNENNHMQDIAESFAAMERELEQIRTSSQADNSDQQDRACSA